MRYNLEFTPLTRIKSIATYLQRVREIFCGQIKNLFSPARFLTWFFWVFAIFFIPCSMIYFAFSFVEFIMDSILLVLFLIPIVRIVPTAIEIIIWSLTIAIGRFSFVDLTYDV